MRRRYLCSGGNGRTAELLRALEHTLIVALFLYVSPKSCTNICSFIYSAFIHKCSWRQEHEQCLSKLQGHDSQHGNETTLFVPRNVFKIQMEIPSCKEISLKQHTHQILNISI